MSDTGTPSGETPTVTDSTPAATTTPETPADPWANIPEEWAWTKSAVESANREAASRRVALRELEEKVKDAKTPEEFNAATAEFTQKEQELTRSLARERAARKHKLDDDILEFLTGATEEQIEAQAVKLAAFKPGAEKQVVITQPPPSGGATPGEGADPNVDGKSEWKRYKDRHSR